MMRCAQAPRFSLLPRQRCIHTAFTSSATPNSINSQPQRSFLNNKRNKLRNNIVDLQATGVTSNGDIEELKSSRSTKASTTTVVLPWLKGKVQKGFWSSPQNQRLYMDWLGEQLGFKNREDWYRVTKRSFVDNAGSGLLWRYNDSPSAVVIAVYKDYKYLPWLFDVTFRGYFTYVENRREYIKWLVEQVGVNSAGELETRHFLENHGQGLLFKYEKSPHKILESLNAESTFSHRSSRARKPHHYWVSMENRRKFMDSMGAKIGIKGDDLSPWYDVTSADISEEGGARLLKLYNDSLSVLLRSIYPDFDWIPWRFNRLPKEALRDPEVLKQAIEYGEKKLSLVKVEEWYRVSRGQLEDLGIYHLIKSGGGIYNVLKNSRPEFNWELSLFQMNQKRLHLMKIRKKAATEAANTTL